MRETWYVLEDGAVVDPAEVGHDENGALRHTSGIAVSMKGQVPHTRGVDDPEQERARSKDMKPEKPKRGYKTREVKSDD